MDFLADVGVNENILKRISDAAQEFETALNIQQDKVADRDIAVERRTEQGNKLYQELVVLCDIGKDIWAEKIRSTMKIIAFTKAITIRRKPGNKGRIKKPNRRKTE